MSTTALPPTLTVLQDRVIEALTEGSSLSEAAEQAGIHRNTIGNWRRSSQPFRAALALAFYERALLVREQAAALAGDAVKTIRDILADPKASPSVRLKAALAILGTASTPPPEAPCVCETAPAAPEPPIEHKSAQVGPLPFRRETPKIGRNEPCPCGSGRKYKLCCLHDVTAGFTAA